MSLLSAMVPMVLLTSAAWAHEIPVEFDPGVAHDMETRRTGPSVGMSFRFGSWAVGITGDVLFGAVRGPPRFFVASDGEAPEGRASFDRGHGLLLASWGPARRVAERRWTGGMVVLAGIGLRVAERLVWRAGEGPLFEKTELRPAGLVGIGCEIDTGRRTGARLVWIGQVTPFHTATVAPEPARNTVRLLWTPRAELVVVL